MARRYFIRPKDGEWEEITDEDIKVVNQSYGDQTPDQQHARMARRHGIEGDFEIEVRFLESGVWATDRSTSGTTAILADAAK